MVRGLLLVCMQATALLAAPAPSEQWNSKDAMEALQDRLDSQKDLADWREEQAEAWKNRFGQLSPPRPSKSNAQSLSWSDWFKGSSSSSPFSGLFGGRPHSSSSGARPKPAIQASHGGQDHSEAQDGHAKQAISPSAEMNEGAAHAEAMPPAPASPAAPEVAEANASGAAQQQEASKASEAMLASSSTATKAYSTSGSSNRGNRGGSGQSGNLGSSPSSYRGSGSPPKGSSSPYGSQGSRGGSSYYGSGFPRPGSSASSKAKTATSNKPATVASPKPNTVASPKSDASMTPSPEPSKPETAKSDTAKSVPSASSQPASTMTPKPESAKPETVKTTANPQATSNEKKPSAEKAPLSSAAPSTAPKPATADATDVKKRGSFHPTAGTKWQIVLDGVPDTKASIKPADATVWDIDLWDAKPADIAGLHKTGAKVICYFSAGTSESWRPDYNQLSKFNLGKICKQDDCKAYWGGEQWVDPRSKEVWEVMKKRIKLASDKGCDAVDPDNMDFYDNTIKGPKGNTKITEADSVRYLKMMSEEAGKFNMSTGLKNSISILPQVQSYISFAVNEECVKNRDCGAYGSFLARDKAVFHIEYTNAAKSASRVMYKDAQASTKKYCNPGGSKKFSTIIKPGNSLSASYLYCDGQPADQTKMIADSSSKQSRGAKKENFAVVNIAGDDTMLEDEIVEAPEDGTAAMSQVDDTTILPVLAADSIVINETLTVRRSVPMLYRRQLLW